MLNCADMGLALTDVYDSMAWPNASIPQTAVTRRFGAWWGIAGSALLFAALHGTLWSLIPLAVLGLALGWVSDRYLNLWPAIALHIAYNGVLVAATFLATAR